MLFCSRMTAPTNFCKCNGINGCYGYMGVPAINAKNGCYGFFAFSQKQMLKRMLRLFSLFHKNTKQGYLSICSFGLLDLNIVPAPP